MPAAVNKASDNNKIDTVKAGTILIAEDNPEMSDFICRILSQEFNTIAAMNGREALNILKDKDTEIDLILADIMMPVMDGYSLLSEVRKETHYSRLPVIMLTAKADDKTKISSLETGANDYLTKPFNARELLLRVRTQVHLKRFMDELLEKTGAKNEGRKNITDKTKKKLGEVIEFINMNFRDIITRENLADLLEMSPDHFSRMFKQYTGKKVQDYINDLRIGYASQMLLESDKKIIEIAMDAGFDTLRSFNRDFSEKMKMSPSEYRLKNNFNSVTNYR